MDFEKPRKRSREVESYDSTRLLEVFEAHPEAIGLAAPQIGDYSRVFVLRLEGKPVVFINPEIIAISTEVEESTEGCLSLPGVYATLYRHKLVIVGATNEEGNKFTAVLTGLAAHAAQHENDHLDGILITDKPTLGPPALEEPQAQPL